MGPTQDLQQKVCQKYGWSLVYSRNENGTWQADIVTGWQDKKSFVTEEGYDKGMDKEGKAAVSQLALQGLAVEIQRMESLPVQELSQVFYSIWRTTSDSELELLDSMDPSTWTRFWNDAPTVVGIDTEGNSISPPVLVQIATRTYSILETPQQQCGLSNDLNRLLHDHSITKVFCDNFAHKDKHVLGLGMPTSEGAAEDKVGDVMYTTPPIVDLESLLQQHLGPVKTPRGLGRIVSLTMPELQVRIEKPLRTKGGTKARFANIGRFALIEQGKAKPLTGLRDLPHKEQQYAAIDAWFTLAVYERLQQDSVSRQEGD